MHERPLQLLASCYKEGHCYDSAHAADPLCVAVQEAPSS
jgi:hypothetical protein